MRYVSMLRGINVSGQKKINMTDLKSLYEDSGFEHVVTYIQSGNVVFNIQEKKLKKNIEKTIEAAIQTQYGFDVPVLIRTHDEISRVIQHCPFTSIDFEKEGSKILVTFLSSTPSVEAVKNIQPYVAASESLFVDGKEIYLHCPEGYGRSKLSNAFFEKKMDVVATTRNWKTVCKLHELSEAST